MHRTEANHPEPESNIQTQDPPHSAYVQPQQNPILLFVAVAEVEQQLRDQVLNPS